MSRELKTVWKLCRVFLLAALCSLFTAGCAFTPHDGSGASPNASFNEVEIGSIPDREGQYLRNALIDRMYTQGRPASADYVLDIRPIKETRIDLDITKNASATRAQLRLTTSMMLTEKATGQAVLKRDLTSLNSYNILASQFTTRVSEQNVREAALDDLARQIETQLALYFKRR